MERLPAAPDQQLAARIADLEQVVRELIASGRSPNSHEAPASRRSSEELTAAMWGTNGRLGARRFDASRPSRASTDVLSIRLLFMLPPER